MEALSTLCRLRRVPATDDRVKLELLEIKAAAIFDQETDIARFPGTQSGFMRALGQYQELFTVRHLNRRLLIACMLQIIQQFTGISKCSETAWTEPNKTDNFCRCNHIVSLTPAGISIHIGLLLTCCSYAPQIFRSIGLSGNSTDLLATGVVGVINFFSTIPAIMFLDR